MIWKTILNDKARLVFKMVVFRSKVNVVPVTFTVNTSSTMLASVRDPLKSSSVSNIKLDI